MPDVLTPTQRSYCMSQIKGKDTKPEVALRKSLWNLGFRHRIKNKLPGRPDIVYPSIQVAVFVDGCFWHKCPEHYVHPKTRAEFWEKKIAENVERDRKNSALLESRGWLVVRVWEHEIRESLSDCVERLAAIFSDQQAKHFPANDLSKK